MYISMANGEMFVYRCCVQLFIIIHLVPILIHKSIAMCIMVALHCCINILNCISKYLFTNINLLVLCCSFEVHSHSLCVISVHFCICCIYNLLTSWSHPTQRVTHACAAQLSPASPRNQHGAERNRDAQRSMCATAEKGEATEEMALQKGQQHQSCQLSHISVISDALRPHLRSPQVPKLEYADVWPLLIANQLSTLVSPFTQAK